LANELRHWAVHSSRKGGKEGKESSRPLTADRCKDEREEDVEATTNLKKERDGFIAICVAWRP